MSFIDAVINGGGVFILGFSIVFIGLILLLGYIIVQSLILNPKKPRAKKQPSGVKVKPSNDFVGQVSLDEKKVIAAITAAACAYMGASSGDVVIKSYRRIGSSSPAWRQAGRRDQIFNKF